MSKQPNFILFMTDQQRWDHLGCNGNKILRTPHIDSISARGSNFDHFIVSSAVCMPNRSTLMTGRMPSLHGVRYNGVPLRRDMVTFVDLLRAAGYRTGLVGKSHLQNFTNIRAAMPEDDDIGDVPPAELSEARRGMLSGSEYEAEKIPQNDRRGYLDLTTPFYGFDHVELCTLHGDRVHGHYDVWLKERHPDADDLRGPGNAQATPDYSAPQAWHTSIPPEHYPSSYVAERSEAYLKAHSAAGSKEPFFLQCSFPDPHHPYTPPGDYFHKYNPDDIPLPESYLDPSPEPTVDYVRQQTKAGKVDRHRIFPFASNERETREIIALTYGMIAMIDDCIGRILSKLESLGLTEDTVILFTSDHGDFMGDHGIMLKGPLHYQGLIKVPFIWADPKDGQAGVVNSGLSSTIDIPRTILARAGLAPFNGMQGHDLGPLIRGEVEAIRDGVVVEQDAQRANFHFRGPIRARTYVTERWRLSRYMGTNYGELYDLKNDPLEKNNLWRDPDFAATRAELQDELLMRMIEGQESSPHPTNFA